MGSTLRKGSRPRLVVSVCDVRGRPVRVPGLAAWLMNLAPRATRGTVTIVLASDAAVRRLNRHWRGVDHATDVLSFCGGSDERWPALAPSRTAHLGDIVIATGVAARQARAAGHALRLELRVLALHGFLHLVGYDHDRDTGEMARMERRLRRRGGLEAGLIERAPGDRPVASLTAR
jgi:probable rRNA maturation factor